MQNAKITGWGKCLPPASLSNDDLAQIVDTSDEWITTRTGIKERRICHVDVSDMAAVAAQHALAAAGLEATDLDLVIVGTCTGDSTIPSTASKVQEIIGATGCAAMDLNAACSGFIYGLVVGTNMIRAGTNSRVLVIGAEKLSYHLNFADRSTCVLFGDGAGAVVLEPADSETGVLATELGLDGTARSLLEIPVSGTQGERRPPDPETAGITMNGPEVFRRAVTTMGDAAVRVVEKSGLTLDDVDLLIPHQANTRIIDATARRLRLDRDKVFINIGSYGNTSAATIPVALAEAIEQDRITPGDVIVFAAFGAGLSWAAATVRWGDRVTPVATSDAALPPTDRTAMELIQPNIDFFGLGAR